MRSKCAAVARTLSPVRLSHGQCCPSTRPRCLRKVRAGYGWQMTHSLKVLCWHASFSSSSEPSTHANSCGVAIPTTPTSVRLRRGPHSTEPSVLLGRWVCLLVTTLHRAPHGGPSKAQWTMPSAGRFPFCGCYHEQPQSWWFQTLEVSSVIAMEDKSELYWGEAQCGQGCAHTRDCSGTWFLPFPSSWLPSTPWPHSSDL